MSTLYDSTAAQDIPANAQIVAGYIDGLYKWSANDWARFPNAQKIGIAVFASTNDGLVLDCEAGDATPSQCPAWVQARRAAGVTNATVYCSKSVVPSVLAAFATAGVAAPLIWDADWTGAAHLNPGSVATQYANPPASGGHYDVSLTNGVWPAVAPTPTPPSPKDIMPTIGNYAPWNQTTNGNNYTLQALLIRKFAQQISYDGICGPATAQAIKNVQLFFKIPGGADGIAGPNTWDVLLHI